MSVQCKNCQRGLKEDTKIFCIGWKNSKYVSSKKQIQCMKFLKREGN